MTGEITNRTSHPTGEVRRLVRWTLKTFEADDVDVRVKVSRYPDGQTSGRYRNWWYPGRGETRPVITVSLPRPEYPIEPYEPYSRVREQGKVIDLADWREALVAVVAHEATHHRQRHTGKGVTREVDCDLAAARAVDYYREREARRQRRSATMVA